VGEVRIEQVFELLGADLQIQYAVDRPADGTDGLATGIHRDATADHVGQFDRLGRWDARMVRI
jgi:hypothetical protein